MISTREKQIPGKVNGESKDVDYAVTQFPAMQGIRLSVRLAKMFGSGIGEAAAGGLNAALDMDIGNMVGAIMTNLDADESASVIMELLSRTERNGVKLTQEVFDKVYAANYQELAAALMFVLEVNYGGFFAALGDNTLIGNLPGAGAENKK